MNVTMPHPFKTAKHLFLGAALCGLVGVICFFGGRLSAGGGAESPQLDAVVLESRLEDIRELATVTYAYTNMAQFESSNDFYGVKVPFTTKSFILTYDGTIKAGMDLKDADLQLSGTTLTVHLPQAVILSHEIDEGSVEVFDEKTSIFNPFTVEDFTAFQADQKAAMEEKALARGLLSQARAQGEAAVRRILETVLPEGTVLKFT